MIGAEPLLSSEAITVLGKKLGEKYEKNPNTPGISTRLAVSMLNTIEALEKNMATLFTEKNQLIFENNDLRQAVASLSSKVLRLEAPEDVEEEIDVEDVVSAPSSSTVLRPPFPESPKNIDKGAVEALEKEHPSHVPTPTEADATACDCDPRMGEWCSSPSCHGTKPR